MSGDTGKSKKEKPGDEVTTLHSLGELGGVDLGQRLYLPEIDLASLDPEALLANAAKIEEVQAQIKEWVPRHLAALAAVDGLPPKAQRLARAKVAEVQEGLNEILGHGNEYYRLAGRLALIRFRFSQDLHGMEEVEKVLLKLVEDGYLEETTAKKVGLIRFNDRLFSYRVPTPKDPDGEEVDLEEAEQKELGDAFFDLYYRVRSAETLGDITWDKFRGHQPGTITLGIVPEEVTEGGSSHRLPGAQFRVRSDGEKVVPVRISTGNQRLQDGIEKAKDRGVYITLADLDANKEPPIGGLRYLLYTLVKRAEKPELARQEMRRQEEEMAASLVTVPNEDFFLGGKPGIPHVSLAGWKTKDTKGNPTGVLYDVYFFPERILEEGADGENPVSFISLLPERVPDHVRKYLDPFAAAYDKAEKANGNEKRSFWGPHPEGEDFSGLPYPLSSLMRRARNLTGKTAQIGNGGK